MSNKRIARSRRPPRRRGTSKATRWVWIGVGLVVIGAFVLAVVLSRGGGGNQEASAGEIGTAVTVDGTALTPFASGSADPAVGQPAPVVTGVNFDGDPVTIGGSGPEIVAFVAHWCPHCQNEVPELVQAGNSPDWPDNVEVVAVASATSDNRDNYPPSAWLARENWQWDVLADDADSAASQAYGLSGFPFLVFLDADGNVALRTAGELQGGSETYLQLAQALSQGQPLAAPQTGATSGN